MKPGQVISITFLFISAPGLENDADVLDIMIICV